MLPPHWCSTQGFHFCQPRFDILSSPFFQKCMEGKFFNATFGPNFDRCPGKVCMSLDRQQTKTKTNIIYILLYILYILNLLHIYMISYIICGVLMLPPWYGHVMSPVCSGGGLLFLSHSVAWLRKASMSLAKDDPVLREPWHSDYIKQSWNMFQPVNMFHFGLMACASLP